MARKRKQPAQRDVAIEVGGSTLRLAILRAAHGEAPEVTVHAVRWRREASSLHSETGQRELNAAMKQLAADYKLVGADVQLALNGDYCVTRVATGAAEDVKYEMAELEHRSQLYLSLGPGRKALAGSVRQLDARHQHALLSVTNQRTIDAVTSAAAAAGLKVRHMEPALFALTRILSRLQIDQAEPVMVLNMAEKGVEVGVFYGGMLLLEYRPGGRAVLENVAQIILQHLPRLKRYVGRNFRFISGSLKTIYLCGERAAVERMLQDFSTQDALRAAPLELGALAPQLTFVDGTPESPFAASLGAVLADERADSDGPNLLRHLQQSANSSLGRGAWKLLWPAAAAAVLLIASFIFTQCEAWRVAEFQRELDALNAIRLESRRLKLQLTQAESKGKMLAELEEQLAQPDWGQLWTTIGGCLPPDVWIDSMKIDGNGTVSISGTCYQEHGAFELVRWLKQAPQFSDVALTSTRPMRFNSAPALNFQLEGRLANLDDSEGRTVRND